MSFVQMQTRGVKKYNSSGNDGVEEVIAENRYLNKKMKGREVEIRELREKCEGLEKENKELEEERNLLMREKLNMGIEIARLNEENLMLLAQSKILK